jgi:hypothetical protein
MCAGVCAPHLLEACKKAKCLGQAPTPCGPPAALQQASVVLECGAQMWCDVQLRGMSVSLHGARFPILSHVAVALCSAALPEGL